MFYAPRDFGDAAFYMFYCQGSSGYEVIILLTLEQLYYEQEEVVSSVA